MKVDAGTMQLFVTMRKKEGRDNYEAAAESFLY
jgi:hypothetical protein